MNNTLTPPPGKPARRLLRTTAYDAILDAILDGRLEPGEILRDSDLTQWLGLSRTPIREALNQLAAKGLIEQEVHRYTRVAPLDVDRYEQSAEAMAMLVRHLAAECTRRGGPTNALQGAFDTVETATTAAEFAAASGAYISVLAEAAGNIVAGHAIASLLPAMQRMMLARPERFDQDTLTRQLAALHQSIATTTAA